MLGEPSSVAHLRPLIERALTGEYTIEDLYTSVLTGAMQLWVSPDNDAVVFTEVVNYPRLRSIRVVIAAGLLESVLAFVPIIARWAIARGCIRAELGGRVGWARVIPAFIRRDPMMVANLKDLI